MPQTKLFILTIALSLLSYVCAQSSCINVCTDSANVLTQLKTCSGCGTDDWACFCRCSQYIDAVMSCVEQECQGSAIENSIVSFCSSQGVSISYSSQSATASATTSSGSSTSASGIFQTSASTTGTATSGLPFAVSSGTSSSSTATSSSAFSGSSFTATDSSDISSYLATAIPASARSQSSDACFLNSPYTYYSTPTWYSTLPTQAQSYYSSVNQGNTAACTLSPSAAAALAASQATNNNKHHGLSAGAIAGIVIGAIVALLLLLLLLLCCLRRRRHHNRRDAAAVTRARNLESRNAQPGVYGDKNGFNNGGGIPVSNSRSPYGHGHEKTPLAAAAIPGQHARPQAPYGYNDGLDEAALANGRDVHAPYENGGSNGLAAMPGGRAGHQEPYSAGAGGLGGPGIPSGGMAGGVAGAQNPDYSHTTTTTTRVVMPHRRRY